MRLQVDEAAPVGEASSLPEAKWVRAGVVKPATPRGPCRPCWACSGGRTREIASFATPRRGFYSPPRPVVRDGLRSWMDLHEPKKAGGRPERGRQFLRGVEGLSMTHRVAWLENETTWV